MNEKFPGVKKAAENAGKAMDDEVLKKVGNTKEQVPSDTDLTEGFEKTIQEVKNDTPTTENENPILENLTVGEQVPSDTDLTEGFEETIKQKLAEKESLKDKDNTLDVLDLTEGEDENVEALESKDILPEVVDSSINTESVVDEKSIENEETLADKNKPDEGLLGATDVVEDKENSGVVYKPDSAGNNIPNSNNGEDWPPIPEPITEKSAGSNIVGREELAEKISTINSYINAKVAGNTIGPDGVEEIKKTYESLRDKIGEELDDNESLNDLRKIIEKGLSDELGLDSDINSTGTQTIIESSGDSGESVPVGSKDETSSDENSIDIQTNNESGDQDASADSRELIVYTGNSDNNEVIQISAENDGSSDNSETKTKLKKGFKKLKSLASSPVIVFLTGVPWVIGKSAKLIFKVAKATAIKSVKWVSKALPRAFFGETEFQKYFDMFSDMFSFGKKDGKNKGDKNKK